MMVLIILMPLIILAHEQEGADVREPVKYFIGTWTGESTGKAGDGKGERTYEFIMNGTYVHSRTAMTFESQEKNPGGEVHEDWGFFSFDEGRKRLVMRQFNIEGFVNQYVLDSLSADNKTFILLSESSENAPPGLQARYTYELKGDNEFVEIFELGFPGKEFSCWMTNTWHRKEK